MYLTVTIDTEEDNWGEFDRPSYSVENIKRIPRLQQIFAARCIRPTYLISYPVATDPAAAAILGTYVDRDECEIGTHLHPWNTPPFGEERTVHNSFTSNLPAQVQYRKIRTLHDSIGMRFGAAPRCYRSGKWGFSKDVAQNLIRLGYAVDTSIFPAWDWSPLGGPDFTRYTHEPFVFSLANASGSANTALLEVPATVAFVNGYRGLAGAAYWEIKRRMPLADQILASLNKLRILQHVCLSPEINNSDQMIRLTTALLDRGATVVNMFFHSPSLLPNCSPFVKTEGEVDSFVERIDRFLTFAQKTGLRSQTMSELTAAQIGATHVEMLNRPDEVGSV